MSASVLAPAKTNILRTIQCIVITPVDPWLLIFMTLKTRYAQTAQTAQSRKNKQSQTFTLNKTE